MHLPAVFVLLAVVGVAALRAFLRHDPGEDAADVLALLWTREAGMPFSEIVRSEGIESARVVAALERLDDLGLVQHDKNTDAWVAVVRTQCNEG